MLHRLRDPRRLVVEDAKPASDAGLVIEAIGKPYPRPPVVFRCIPESSVGRNDDVLSARRNARSCVRGSARRLGILQDVGPVSHVQLANGIGPIRGLPVLRPRADFVPDADVYRLFLTDRKSTRLNS